MWLHCLKKTLFLPGSAMAVKLTRQNPITRVENTPNYISLTILSIVDLDKDLKGRNQHPERCEKNLFDCPPDPRLLWEVL